MVFEFWKCNGNEMDLKCFVVDRIRFDWIGFDRMNLINDCHRWPIEQLQCQWAEKSWHWIMRGQIILNHIRQCQWIVCLQHVQFTTWNIVWLLKSNQFKFIMNLNCSKWNYLHSNGSSNIHLRFRHTHWKCDNCCYRCGQPGSQIANKSLHGIPTKRPDKFPCSAVACSRATEFCYAAHWSIANMNRILVNTICNRRINYAILTSWMLTVVLPDVVSFNLVVKSWCSSSIFEIFRLSRSI